MTEMTYICNGFDWKKRENVELYRGKSRTEVGEIIQREVNKVDFKNGELGRFHYYTSLGMPDGISSIFTIHRERFDSRGETEADERITLQNKEVDRLVKCLLGGISDRIVKEINKF